LNIKKTLIVFSTTDGHTKFICEKIQQQLKNRDLVELISIDQHKNINIKEYNTIVFGASIRYGKHNLEIHNFIQNNKIILDKIKTAFFSVNVVARKNEKSTSSTNPYLIKFLKKLDWKPNLTAVFAGKIDYPSYKFIDKQMIRLIMYITKGPTNTSKTYEFTDWQIVKNFSQDLDNLINLN
jgi:menaquinone-dependent protoporphyrinogen oxidase